MRRAPLLGLVALTLAGCGDRARFQVVRVYPRGQTVVRLKVDRTSINVAQTVLVVLEADVPPGTTPRLPDSPIGGFGGFTLQEGGDTPPSPRPPGATRFARWFRLEPFLSGEYAIEPFVVEMVDEHGDKAAVRTERVEIQVDSLLPADYARMDIRDIDGILRARWRAPPALLGALSLLVLATAAAAIWLHRRRRAAHAASAPALPAHLVAYGEIQSLLAEGLVQRGEVKVFYQRVTGILRRYVEHRFGLRAPERTTEEFLGELETTDLLSEEMKVSLRSFLRHADLVKFAELEPLGDEIERTLSHCREFVRATEPTGAPADEVTAADPATAVSRAV
jgi:hypothetical protein